MEISNDDPVIRILQLLPDSERQLAQRLLDELRKRLTDDDLRKVFVQRIAVQPAIEYINSLTMNATSSDSLSQTMKEEWGKDVEHRPWRGLTLDGKFQREASNYKANGKPLSTVLRTIARHYRKLLKDKGIKTQEVQVMATGELLLISTNGDNDGSAAQSLAKMSINEACNAVAESDLKRLAYALLGHDAPENFQQLRHLVESSAVNYHLTGDSDAINQTAGILEKVKQFLEKGLLPPILDAEKAADAINAPEKHAGIIIVRPCANHAEQTLMAVLALSGYKGQTHLQGTKRQCAGCFTSAMLMSTAGYRIDIGRLTCGNVLTTTDADYDQLCHILGVKPGQGLKFARGIAKSIKNDGLQAADSYIGMESESDDENFTATERGILIDSMTDSTPGTLIAQANRRDRQEEPFRHAQGGGAAGVAGGADAAAKPRRVFLLTQNGIWGKQNARLKGLRAVSLMAADTAEFEAHPFKFIRNDARIEVTITESRYTYIVVYRAGNDAGPAMTVPKQPGEKIMLDVGDGLCVADADDLHVCYIARKKSEDFDWLPETPKRFLPSNKTKQVLLDALPSVKKQKVAQNQTPSAPQVPTSVHVYIQQSKGQKDSDNKVAVGSALPGNTFFTPNTNKVLGASAFAAEGTNLIFRYTWKGEIFITRSGAEKPFQSGDAVMTNDVITINLGSGVYVKIKIKGVS
ncbi:hypothetical protein [Streptomyces sp. NPDC126514]|uniref:hypothetical protein n=1 Tax=Streptomyces sp. NPDC126514 TaxID=3155210 RepID=UPI00331BB995